MVAQTIQSGGVGDPPRVSRHRKRRPRVRMLLLGALALFIVCAGAERLRFDLRSYSLLVHFVNPQASGPLLRLETNNVTSGEVTVPSPNGPVPARLYLPVGVAHPPGMLILHGIHHLGITDPRFINFSRAIAGSGFAVLTPEMAALADYHVDATSISIIGESAAWLQQRLGTGPVTIIALSFSGGLALLAACDPRYAPHIRALVPFGSYDDLSRVSRFLATGQEEFPDGRVVPYAAHDYGASVFVYAHLAQFFPPEDLPVAHEALRYWLWEQPSDAQPFLDKLSPSGRATMDALFARRIDFLRPRLLDAIRADQGELAALSPHGHIAQLRAPVYIVHGSNDNVIPPAESLWLENDVPRDDLRGVLITPTFSHVDPRDRGWYAQLQLVDFLARILRAAS